ncbi:type I secretion system permease/ATPase [Afipia sp. 1NLS2]|uniref:type I secretion system permease/ATPase n=1 Tax=Afipia sp. 1NLS2 TaxID=666684 RepID=UPI0001D9E6F5|nr:type I secretion system permease/ATPase [Afipia sp. 1NLS2]EFI51361.1 type I secretion system ATPase [Afipia sp. 1NLS2]
MTKMRADPADTASSPRTIGASLRARSGELAAVAIYSGAINILMLTGSLFMLQVYDRVLPSHSVPTLIGLFVIVVFLYLAQGSLDMIRSRIMVRVGRSLDQDLSQRVCRAVLQLPLHKPSNADGLQPLRDLDQLRSFLSSAGPIAFFDLPWIPLYLALCFAFHFWIGMTATAGALVLIGLALTTEFLVRRSSRNAVGHGIVRLTMAEAGRRNAEVIAAMSMTSALCRRWQEINTNYMDGQQQVSDISVTLGAFSRVFRILLQSAVLAVGAYLVIQQSATTGVIIASSILTSRALAPVELAIGHWKAFLAIRQGWHRLAILLEKPTVVKDPLPLPAPYRSISVQGVHVAPPGQSTHVVREATFELAAGEALGLIGPSASGKSSLARALVGIWQPTSGTVRLDGAPLERWSAEALGRHIGFLPQNIELFDGSVTENIARFEACPDPNAVISAARAAGIHEMILALPDGYETRIGEDGTVLSAGQRQRVALARALYRDPFLIVLDEPNSNLDAEGECALTSAILNVRERGGIVIIIAHRPSALIAVDRLAAMAKSRIQAVGAKEDILRRVLLPPTESERIPAKNTCGAAT